MAVYLSAGVYVKETDLSQVVPTTSTSVGAIVGEYLRGPINTPVLIQNTKQFIDTFGKPDPTRLTWPSPYCSLAFLERSSQLFVVRAVNSDNSHRYAGLKVVNNNGETEYSNTGVSQAVPNDVTLTADQPFYAYSIGPGTYSNNNIGISISSDSVYTPPREIEASDISLVPSTEVGELFTLLSTVYYRVQVVTVDGTTDISSQVSVTLAGTENAVTISIEPQDGATAYRIYRGTATSDVRFLTELNATNEAVTYLDIGTALAAVYPQIATAADELVAIGSASVAVPTDLPTGGTLAFNTTYRYRVAVVVGDEETNVAAEVNVTTANDSNNTHRVQIAIPHVRGATGYNIYGRTTGNIEYIGYAQAETSYDPDMTVPDVLFIDDGSVTPSGTIPVGLGGWDATGTKYYRVSVVSKAGETQASRSYGATVSNVADHVIVAIPRQASASAYKIYRGDTSGQERLLISIPQTEEEGAGFVTYIDEGDAISTEQPLASAITTDGKTPEFTVRVYSSEVSESVEVESFIVTLEDSVDGNGFQQQIEDRINVLSRYIRVYKNLAYTGASYFYDDAGTVQYFTGGVDGNAPTASDIALAWDSFADKEKITVRLLINGGVTAVSVQQKMNALAQRRGDCVAILDMPTQYQSETGLSEVNYRRSILNMNSNRSAIYSPDLYINDPYNDKLLYVPPSGHVAAVYANTDFVAQAWFAPAGLNRGLLNIQSLRFKYNQEARDVLAPAQVNYMRNFPGQGIAVWEALTLQAKTSALSYVNVRRLLDVIQVSVSDALLYSVYEPNDDFLRRQIVSLISEFLDAIRVRRGILEYAVISDDSNNPPSVTSVGQLNVDVYIIPTLPAQKIQLQTVITKQGASFSELIATGGAF